MALATFCVSRLSAGGTRIGPWPANGKPNVVRLWEIKYVGRKTYAKSTTTLARCITEARTRSSNLRHVFTFAIDVRDLVGCPCRSSRSSIRRINNLSTMYFATCIWEYWEVREKGVSPLK